MLNQLLFNSQGEEPTSQSNRTKIFLFGRDIANITGPTPMVDISTTFNSEDGFATSITDTITLTGKIAPSSISSSGITDLLDRYNKLTNLLKSCTMGEFKIDCNGPLYSGSNITVKSYQIDKTDNNWMRTADFSVVLESKRASTSGTQDPNFLIESRSDSWTIEQLEDAQYHAFSMNNLSIGPEYLSKNMLPSPEPSLQQPVPNQAVGGGGIGTGGNTLGIRHAPQYKITRRISAKGLPTLPSGTSNTSSPATCYNDHHALNATKLNNARLWVELQAHKPFHASPSGSIVLPGLGTTNGSSGIHFYNHIRTISADIYNGTYEINDNWLAMPTGITHTEKYTIECSTSENFTKTVRVIGTINGLAKSNPSYYSDKSALTFNNNQLSLALQESSGYPHYAGAMTHSVSDTHSYGSTSPAQPSNSANTSMSSEKYLNAYNAWNKDIKPYLYRRASLGINTGDRIDRPSTPRVGAGQTTVPESPAFFKERLLSPIPVNVSEGHDPFNGAITYTYEFNNKYKALSGVISENINITHDAPADNISETQVLGRYLGPILQAIGRTNARKTITVDVIIQPPMTNEGMLEYTGSSTNVCPIGLPTALRHQINELIQGNQPFSYRNALIFGSAARNNLQGTVYVQSDQETWNPTEGRFSRTVSWIYQQCTGPVPNYMEH